MITRDIFTKDLEYAKVPSRKYIDNKNKTKNKLKTRQLNLPKEDNMAQNKIDLSQLDINKMNKKTGISKKAILRDLQPPEIDEELMKDIRSAENAEQAHIAWTKTEVDTPEQKEAILRWINLCKNARQARLAHAKTRINSSEQTMAMLKWIFLCQTANEVLEALGQTPLNSPERRAAMERLASFYLKKEKNV